MGHPLKYGWEMLTEWEEFQIISFNLEFSLQTLSMVIILQTQKQKHLANLVSSRIFSFFIEIWTKGW